MGFDHNEDIKCFGTEAAVVDQPSDIDCNQNQF